MKKSRMFFWSFIFFLFSHLEAQAKLHYSYLKGMSEKVLLKPACRHLSAKEAFPLIYGPFLSNAANYGNRLESPLEQLISTLFSNPGSDQPENLRTSLFAKNMGRLLSPAAIGTLLKSIYQHFPDLSPQTLAAELLADPSFQLALQSLEGEKKALENQRNSLHQEKVQKIQTHDPEYLELKNKLEIAEQRYELLQPYRNRLLGGNCAELFSNEELLALELAIKVNEEMNAETLDDTTAKKTLFWKAKQLDRTLQQEIQSLRASLNSILNKKTKADLSLRALEKKIAAVQWNPKDLEKFMATLQEAIKPSVSPVSSSSRILAEQALVALAWINTSENDKAGFLKLYQNLSPFCINEIKAGVEADRYTNEDILQMKRKQVPKSLEHVDPEHLPPEAVYQALLDLTPDDVSLKNIQPHLLSKEKVEEMYHQAIYKTGKRVFHLIDQPSDEAEVFKTAVLSQETTLIPYLSEVPPPSFASDGLSYSDCMETSLLTFVMNALLHGEDQFDLQKTEERLSQKLGKSFKLSAELREFFERFPHSSALSTLEAHRAWAEIIYQAPHLRYLGGKTYELQPHLANILRVLDFLFGGIFKADQNEVGKTFQSLCDFLDLEWTAYKETDPSHLEIEFKTKGDTFTWALTSTHSEIRVPRRGLRQVTLAASKFLQSSLLNLSETQRIRSPLTDSRFRTLLRFGGDIPAVNVTLDPDSHPFLKGLNEIDLTLSHLFLNQGVPENKIQLAKFLLKHPSKGRLQQVENVINTLLSEESNDGMMDRLEVLSSVPQPFPNENLENLYQRALAAFKTKEGKAVDKKSFHSTLLSHAIQKDYSAMIDFYKKNKISLTQKDDFYHFSPLYQAVVSEKEESTLALLNALSPSDWNLDLAPSLILQRDGEDYSWRKEYENSPLIEQAAAKCSNPVLLKMLAPASVDFFVEPDPLTGIAPIHHLASKGRLSVLKDLLARKILPPDLLNQVTLPLDSGVAQQTALDIAIAGGDKELVEFLRNSGAKTAKEVLAAH